MNTQFYRNLKPHNSDWDSNPTAPQMGLELSQNSDWYLNPRAGTQTHCLLIEITHLVSGLNEAQLLYVSVQKKFSERQSNR